MKFKKLLMAMMVLVLIMSSALTTSSANSDKGNNGKSGVMPGVEVLLEDNLDWLKGKRVGLITNPTGVSSNLESSIDLLYNHPDVNLTALFGPEHGIRGNREAGEYVESYIDEKTGLPVYSLYGSTWKPSEEMLEEVDVLLFDIQDIGSNVYTYIYTLGFAMEAAAEYNKELIVLDRPNPIGGTKVEGPLRSEDTVSFMGRFLLPVRHGMTVGELATMWNHEYSMGVDLKVSKMKGWKRSMHFEDTGLPWVMTSPNIPTKETAYLYAGTELLDDTSLSTGLGTTRPFEMVGAPWIDGEGLAEEMNSRDINGVTFRSAYFTPMFGKYEGELVGGVQVHIDNPSEIDLVSLGINLVDAIRDQDPEKFEMTSSYANLIGDPDVPDMIMNDMPVDEVIASWEEELNTWVSEVRNQYLLYNPYPSGSNPYKEEGNLGILPLDLTASTDQSVELELKGFDKNGEELEIDPALVDWTVSNDIGYVENGKFHAENKGQGQITAEFNDYTASRDVRVSPTFIENIRYGIHSNYSRIVLDLNKTVDNYEITESEGLLQLEIPYGEINGDLNEKGGTVMVDDSPVLTSIDYHTEDDKFVASFNLIEDDVEYETPEFSSRIVVDLQH
ncbi:exo-beta-N-acetylmuramidase NamZ domain-containing protein [Virgibacillus sp. JSM 102003]|uniref:exo-beta-N-acetylmuramidase NamZ family protein n=1 Tax=Virgibacillus sp. JSM 102003 TaxID=1562108 RepID=UPI0035C039B4